LDTPGSKIRSYIDGIIGVGAISSGYSLFADVRAHLVGQAFFFGKVIFPAHPTATVIFTLDYISWLIFIMMISWPLILPATLFFFFRYQTIVNRFRSQAAKAGIPVGVARIREPYEPEIPLVTAYIENN